MVEGWEIQKETGEGKTIGVAGRKCGGNEIPAKSSVSQLHNLTSFFLKEEAVRKKVKLNMGGAGG